MYNMEKYISSCLESLKIPSIDALDILVINDGSKDNSSKIAHSYEARFPGSIRVIDKENGNYGSCINRGLKEAKGKYIKILDSDDTFATNNLEVFINFLHKTTVDLVVSDYVVIDDSNREKRKQKFPLIPFKELRMEEIVNNHAEFAMHAITYNRDLFSKFQYQQTEGISYTDGEWAFVPMLFVRSIIYFDKGVYRYLIGRTGQTVNNRSYIRNINQLITVALNNMDVYKRDHKEFAEYNREYGFKWLLNFVASIYNKMLLQYYPHIQQEMIIRFDNIVKNTDKTLYLEVGERTTIFNFYYIRYWREHKVVPKIIRYENKVYLFLVNLRNKLINP